MCVHVKDANNNDKVSTQCKAKLQGDGLRLCPGRGRFQCLRLAWKQPKTYDFGVRSGGGPRQAALLAVTVKSSKKKNNSVHNLSGR